MQTTDVRCIAVSPDQYAVQVRGDSLVIGYVRKLGTRVRPWWLTPASGGQTTSARTRREAVTQLVAEYTRTA